VLGFLSIRAVGIGQVVFINDAPLEEGEIVLVHIVVVVQVGFLAQGAAVMSHRRTGCTALEDQEVVLVHEPVIVCVSSCTHTGTSRAGVPFGTGISVIAGIRVVRVHACTIQAGVIRARIPISTIPFTGTRLNSRTIVLRGPPASCTMSNFRRARLPWSLTSNTRIPGWRSSGSANTSRTVYRLFSSPSGTKPTVTDVRPSPPEAPTHGRSPSYREE